MVVDTAKAKRIRIERHPQGDPPRIVAVAARTIEHFPPRLLRLARGAMRRATSWFDYFPPLRP